LKTLLKRFSPGKIEKGKTAQIKKFLVKCQEHRISYLCCKYSSPAATAENQRRRW